ncbi:hypothetical protein ACF0H5_011348 [Mactra antiquata]
MAYSSRYRSTKPGHAQNLLQDSDPSRDRHGTDADRSDNSTETNQPDMPSTMKLFDHLQRIWPLIDKSKQEVSQASTGRRLNTIQDDGVSLELQKKNADLLKQLSDKDDKLKEFEAKFNKKESEAMLKLKRENDELHQKIEELEIAKYKTKNDMDSLSRDNSSLKDKVTKSEQKKEDLIKELDETKTRLSKIIGDKITDNNPDIANLSDENRPTKIAEKYSELYDNDWTDAYEAMEEVIKDEKSVISYLLRILKFIMRQCVRIAEQHSVKITEAVYYTECMPSTVHTEIKKPIKDIRKVAAPFTSKQVQEELLTLLTKKEMNESTPAIHKKAVQQYIKKCTNICWLMVVQDPPLFFDRDVKEYEEFDKSRYREYTKSGSRIEFLVWPAMYLKKGTLLVKGVAQGYGAKDQTRPQTAPPALRSDVSSPLQSLPTDPTVHQDFTHTVRQSNLGYTSQTPDRNYKQSTNCSLLEDKSANMSKSVRNTPTYAEHYQGNANIKKINLEDFYKYPPTGIPSDKWNDFLYYFQGYNYTWAKVYAGKYYHRCLSHYQYLCNAGTTA